MKRNFRKDFSRIARRSPNADDLEVAELVDLASALETQDVDTDSMFRFNIRVPYSEAPVASNSSWSTTDKEASS